jgi:hypothetical protein
LADRTTINVVLDEGGKARPPVVAREEFLGFETARMTSSGRVVVKSDDVVVKSDDVVSKGDVGRYVRKSFIREKSVAQFPVGKSRTDRERNGGIKESVRYTSK